MKIAIIGSRNFKDLPRITEYLLRLKNSGNDVTIISGGARGVDSHAIMQASVLGFKTNVILPDFATGYNVSAYHKRNDMIIEESDKVVAFWDHVSTGTKSVIYKCLERGKNIEVIFDEDYR